MMTTNLFVIANVKQLRTDGSFWILLPFFRTSLSVGFLNSAIFNSFHSRVEFGKILVGLRKFEGGLNNLPPPPVRHCQIANFSWFQKLSPCSECCVLSSGWFSCVYQRVLSTCQGLRPVLSAATVLYMNTPRPTEKKKITQSQTQSVSWSA